MSVIEYEDKYTCRKCKGTNTIHVKDRCGYVIVECETSCIVCGFQDYWATGFFESGIATLDEVKATQKGE